MPQAQVQLDVTERSATDISDSTSNAPSSASVRQPPTAEELLQRGLAALEATPKDERGTSHLINDVAELLREQGRLVEARFVRCRRFPFGLPFACIALILSFTHR